MREYKCDVLIVGGGIAGTAAALGACAAGAETMLIERGNCLGGLAVQAGIGAFNGIYTCGENPRKCAAGVADTILEEMRKLSPGSVETVISANGNQNVQYKPEYLKLALDNLTVRSGVDLFFYTVCIGGRSEGGRIAEARFCDEEGEFRVFAGAYVDASGDAGFSHRIGARTKWGDGASPVQAATLPFRLCGVDTGKDLSPDAMEKAVRKGKEAGIPYLTKERGYIQTMSGSGEVAVLLASVAVTGLGGREQAEMEIAARRQILSYVEAFRRFLPGMEHCELTMIGPALGLRETRRMVGRYEVSAEDVLERRKHPDSVARGGWKPEFHRNPGERGIYCDVPPASWYEIPLDALRSADLENLYGCGRVISSDSTAFAAARVMGTCISTGQAAGVAAALQAGTGAVDVGKIRGELLRQGALL